METHRTVAYYLREFAELPSSWPLRVLGGLQRVVLTPLFSFRIPRVPGKMFAAETGQMFSVETGQMSAVETGQMSAVETRQMYVFY